MVAGNERAVVVAEANVRLQYLARSAELGRLNNLSTVVQQLQQSTLLSSTLYS